MVSFDTISFKYYSSIGHSQSRLTTSFLKTLYNFFVLLYLFSCSLLSIIVTPFLTDSISNNKELSKVDIGMKLSRKNRFGSDVSCKDSITQSFFFDDKQNILRSCLKSIIVLSALICFITMSLKETNQSSFVKYFIDKMLAT